MKISIIMIIKSLFFKFSNSVYQDLICFPPKQNIGFCVPKIITTYICCVFEIYFVVFSELFCRS